MVEEETQAIDSKQILGEEKEEQGVVMIDNMDKQVMVDSDNKERRFIKASRRMNGGGSVGLVQARIETFLKISEDQVAKMGSTKKRKVASLEDRLKPNTKKKQKK